MPIILATQEAEIWKAEGQSQPRQNIMGNPPTPQSIRIVVHTYNPSYIISIGRRIEVQGLSQTKLQDPL
jgi:hypothetical protein